MEIVIPYKQQQQNSSCQFGEELATRFSYFSLCVCNSGVQQALQLQGSV